MAFLDLTGLTYFKGKLLDKIASEYAGAAHSHGSISNDGKVGSDSGKPLITTTSGAVTTGSFGSAAGTFCQGNDSRLSNARTPTAHSHGSISNDGKVGSAAGLPLVTSTGGVVATGSFGTSAGTFCEGNDSRLSDARTPLGHAHGSITSDGKVGTASGKPLITTTGGAVTAGSFGTTAGTFCQGNDSRLSDARTPTAHSHGNITNDGKVGTTAGLPLITSTSGAVVAGQFGSAAGTFCQGNDSRLSDARTPTAHNQAANTINAMTGYSKGASYTAITTTDSLNTAIGKLEAGMSDIATTITGGIKVKGSLGTGGTETALPATHSVGDAYYAIAGAPSVGGTALEAGDMAVCVKAGTVAADADWIVVQNNVDTMTGATSAAAGKRGLVPAPASGYQGRFLRGDGTWVAVTDTKVTNTLATTSKAYITGTLSATTNTGTQVFDTGVYLTTSAGELAATNFLGKINGFTISTSVPANAVFTDTTYAAITNAEIDGLFA